MLVTTLFVQALVATAALAIPSSHTRHSARAARRVSGGVRQSRPNAANETHPSYSSNWSGAVLNANEVRYPLFSLTGHTHLGCRARTHP